MCIQEMSAAELVIKNRLGLHARAAARLAQTAAGYEADIRLVKNGEAADAKSVLSLISLGCAYASAVRIEARGIDAPGAVDALKNIILDRFGEE